jgi:hypothetical protein
MLLARELVTDSGVESVDQLLLLLLLLLLEMDKSMVAMTGLFSVVDLPMQVQIDLGMLQAMKWN